MKSSTIGTPWVAAACVALAASLGAAEPAHASKGERYLFALTSVEAEKKVPEPVAAEIRERMEHVIDASEVLLAELPDGAPDPDDEPEKFAAYLEARDLRAFRVRVEVTGYKAEVDELPEPKTGHQVTVHVALRIFGEVIPEHTMGFTGDGSATIRVPTGRKVRTRDKTFAHEKAVSMAVKEAIATSLSKLGADDTKKKR